MNGDDVPTDSGTERHSNNGPGTANALPRIVRIATPPARPPVQASALPGSRKRYPMLRTVSISPALLPGFLRMKRIRTSIVESNTRTSPRILTNMSKCHSSPDHWLFAGLSVRGSAVTRPPIRRAARHRRILGGRCWLPVQSCFAGKWQRHSRQA